MLNDITIYVLECDNFQKTKNNEFSEELYKKTGASHCMMSVYHLQANGLVKRQNQSIKRTFVKVLENAAHEWPSINGVLFLMQIRKHKSTGFSPFILLYQREFVLPINKDWNLIEYNDNLIPKDNGVKQQKSNFRNFQ